jgi:2-haloacid dehalogenase
MGTDTPAVASFGLSARTFGTAHFRVTKFALIIGQKTGYTSYTKNQMKYTQFAEKVKPHSSQKTHVRSTSPKRYEAFILDADNTLFDFNRAERAALQESLEASGYKQLPEEIFLHYHRINEELWKLFERGSIDQGHLRIERFRLLVARLSPPVGRSRAEDPSVIGKLYIEALSEKGYLLDHALPVLKELSAAVPLLLLSNGIARVQRRRINRSGIARYFKEILISAEVGLAKPDPAIFALAVEKLQCPKERILCVGDSPSSDIRGGHAAGIDTCWIAPPGSPYPPEEPPPVHRISDLRQLLDFLPRSQL